MIFEQIQTGGDRNYGYLIACEKEKVCAVVDPSPDPMPVIKRISELGLNVLYLINTHGHYDHTGGNEKFKQKFNLKLIMHPSSPTADIKVEDKQAVKLGTLMLSFIHTPGHTEDSICIRVEDELVTGDTLFVGKIGGTYSDAQAEVEFESLKRLMQLHDKTRVWPGHNYGVKPSSTIGEERRSNPFILQLHSFVDFLYLKNNWAAYKREHGIQ
ncbi:MAG: MBL fold metallo-hydrolase [Spirochaetales bacterium]|nr:MBL fold metallo-hydrolase [Spirochaetales bacterium]